MLLPAVLQYAPTCTDTHGYRDCYYRNSWQELPRIRCIYMSRRNAMGNQEKHRFTPSPTKGRGFVDVILSLQCQATTLVVVLTTCVAIVVAGFLVRASVSSLRNQRAEQLVELASMVAKATASSIEQSDLATLDRVSSEITDGTSLAFVQFVDAAGSPLAESFHPTATNIKNVIHNARFKRAATGQPTLYVDKESKARFLDVVYPVNVFVASSGDDGSYSSLVGYVRTGMVAQAWHQLLASKLDTMTGMGVIIAVLGVPLGFMVVRKITTPLDELADSMDRFAEGDLDVRSNARRRDEIGRLALAFNRMADKHQRLYSRSLRLNAVLERRVAKRTAQLRDLASRESLTGLYNRRRFNEVLQHSFSEASRYDHDLSCIMFDLNDFKAVNDQFGHPAGDEVLILMATTIKSELRSADVAARYGGDEFIVLLPQTDAEQARVLAERIAMHFVEGVSRRLPDARTGVSMGIASLRELPSASPDELIRTADRMLYQDKSKVQDRPSTESGTSAPISA